MKRFSRLASLVLAVTCSLTVNTFASVLPVDHDIAALKLKAAQLEYFKAFLAEHKCTVSFSKTQVGLSPNALRSEGVRIAIGDEFPGNYLGYHNEPQPLDLFNDIKNVFRDESKVNGAAVFSATLIQGPEETSPSRIRVELRDPRLITEPIDDDPADGTVSEWQYVLLTSFINLPLSSQGEAIEMKTKTGKSFRVSCK